MRITTQITAIRDNKTYIGISETEFKTRFD